MREATRRIDVLEMQLREAGIIPEAAAVPQPAVPDTAMAAQAAAGEQVSEPFPAEDDEEPEWAPEATATEMAAIAASATPPNPTRATCSRWAATTANQRPPAPVIPPWLSNSPPARSSAAIRFVKIGVLILFLGLAFLLRFVAESPVVPIELRYAGVAAAGSACCGGWRWRKERTATA